MHRSTVFTRRRDGTRHRRTRHESRHRRTASARPRRHELSGAPPSRRHRRSCAWAFTTGLARIGDSRDNSSTVAQVVNPQHSKLTTSKSGDDASGGLLYVSEVPEVPREKSSSTKKPNEPPPPMATLLSEQSAKYELVPVQPYTSTFVMRFWRGDDEKPRNKLPGLFMSHLFVFRHRNDCPVP